MSDEWEVVRSKAPIKEIKVGDSLVTFYPTGDVFNIETFFVGLQTLNAGQLENLGKALIELANQGSYKDPNLDF